MSRVQMGLRWNFRLGLRWRPRSDSKSEFRFGVSIGQLGFRVGLNQHPAKVGWKLKFGL